MIRSVMLYGGLLVVTLVVAWVRFTAEPDPTRDGEIVLLKGDPEDIEKIVWNTEDDQITVESREDDRGPYLWVDLTHYDERPIPVETPPALQDDEGDAEDVPAPEPEMERVEEKMSFMVGFNAENLLKGLSPMVAIRKFEDVNAEQLEVMGLNDPRGEFQVIRKGRTATLQLGSEAFGTRDVYMRDTRDNGIYLVNDEAVRQLRYARTRLPNRRLIGFEPEEIVSAKLSKDGLAELSLTQQNPADEKNARWVRAETPGVEDTQVNTWMGKALELRGSKYILPEELPEDLSPRFTVAYTNDAGEVDTVEVFQDGEGGEFFARSEFTRGTLQLLKSSTRALAEDVEDVITKSPE